MTTTPLAIETRYKGCRFRSRLEARWAVFMDALELKWDYEPEGFHLPSGNYLPDFWVPSLGATTSGAWSGAWLEIKPTVLPEGEFESREDRLCAELSEHTGKQVYLIRGSIPSGEEMRTNWFNTAYDKLTITPYPCWDNLYAWCICPACLRIGIEFEGRGWRVCGEQCPRFGLGKLNPTPRWTQRFGHGTMTSLDGKDHSIGNGYSADLLAFAYDRARAARFEHGEQG